MKNCYLVLAKDSVERRDEVRKIVAEASAPVKVFSGEKVTKEQLAAELEAIPVFSDRQVIHVKEADALKAAVRDYLAEYAGSFNPKIILILEGESVAANTRLYKKMGSVIDLRKGDKPWEAQKKCAEWLVKRAEQEGKRLHPQAIGRLLAFGGAHRELLEKELEKVICYVAERETIEEADVNAVGIATNQETIWKLCDALYALEKREALCVLHALLDEGAEPIGMLRQLRGQVQKMLFINASLSQGQSLESVSAAYPYLKGNLLQKTVSTAQKYGYNRCRRAIVTIDRAEFAVKNDAISPDWILEKALLEMMQ